MTDTTAHPPWFSPEMPRAEECVLAAILERQAEQDPERLLMLFEDGTAWTAAETLDMTRRVATALKDLGVTAGDRILAWLPNGPSMVRAWFATNYLGATLVPLNTSYRGKLLSHVITLSGSRLLIGHASLLPRLVDIEIG